MIYEKEYNRALVNSVVVKMLYSLSLYSLMMVECLLNRQDAIWNGTLYSAGNWELSLGRWAIRFLDKMHFGIAVNPFVSIITLLLFVIGTCLITVLFDIKIGSVIDYCTSLVFISNMIVCISISYIYTSMIYGLSFVLSISFILLVKKLVEQ